MKRPYSEGTLFLVPLRQGGYARGVVARADPEGKILLGYFFGPRLKSNVAVTMNDLDPNNAVICVRFGALGLQNGEWQILGNISNWKRSEWPMPDFTRRDPMGKMKPRLVHYSDDNPSRIEREYAIDAESGLETDSLSGYGD